MPNAVSGALGPRSDAAATTTGNDLVAQVLRDRRFLLNDGPVTLEPIANMIRLPAEHERHAIDYHAIVRDSRQRIFLLYNSRERADATRAVARFRYLPAANPAEDRFEFDRLLGERDWAEGTPHGMCVVRQSDGHGRATDERLLIVNTAGTVIACDLDGRLRWKTPPRDAGVEKPTSTAAAPGGGVFGLVDGYGTNRNLLCSLETGEVLATTGAKGQGDGRSTCNHGVSVDPHGDFVIADRGNQRLTWWTADPFEPRMGGALQKQLAMPGLEPCKVSWLGEHAVIPCLNSRLAFLAPDGAAPSGYRIAAVVEMPPELIAAGIDGIHDAEFTPDGRYVIVGVWERHRQERQIPTLTAFRLDWPEMQRALPS